MMISFATQMLADNKLLPTIEIHCVLKQQQIVCNPWKSIRMANVSYQSTGSSYLAAALTLKLLSEATVLLVKLHYLTSATNPANDS